MVNYDGLMAVRFSLAWLLACCALGAQTFYKDVLPILQKHCQECHREGEAAPMPLITYRQTRPWAKAIRSAVVSRKMPPWFADPHYGKFANNPSLSAAEISTVTGWVRNGAPQGNPQDAPAPAVFAAGWRIPTPDAIFEMSQPFSVPAAGAVDYMYFTVPTHFTEDRWVDNIEVRPGNRSVVHHAIVYVQGEHGLMDAQYLGGYAPGAVPQQWKPGQARLIPSGATLIFQLHYTANGKPSTDRTRIGLGFAKQRPTQQIVAAQAVNPWMEIPPGDPNYRVDSMRTVPQTAYLVGLRAHMHVRGKSFEFRAVYPDGRREVLLNIPNYDFNWQPYYYLEAPLKLPPGTRIECTAYFDNSPNNPFNPDPKAAVRYGPQSWEEMMIGWLDIAVPAP